MPGRITPLINGEIYHIYNRGAEKRDIFTNSRDYRRFLKTIYYYQFKGPKPKFSKFTHSKINTFNPSPKNKMVEIICYCFMPNHFHFLIRQLKDNGISIFLSHISNSYTKYFNVKNKRVGSLLQGTFKAILVESDEYLLHLSRYIHINPVVSGITKNLDEFSWSSYNEYVNASSNLCSTDIILNFFGSREMYKQFLEDQISYGEGLERIKHSLLDIDD
ncbi:MAG: transposase [Candidatus Daviesbacteria bacterium]|nr:transposase [Candidatus Daviesbacteria bacterium]